MFFKLEQSSGVYSGFAGHVLAKYCLYVFSKKQSECTSVQLRDCDIKFEHVGVIERSDELIQSAIVDSYGQVMMIALLIDGTDVVQAGATIKGFIVISHLRFEGDFDQIVSRLYV